MSPCLGCPGRSPVRPSPLHATGYIAVLQDRFRLMMFTTIEHKDVNQMKLAQSY